MLFLRDIGKLYDGTSDEPSSVHSGVDLVIDGARVHEIVRHDPDLPIGDGHVAIDASAWTITPGIVDCHGHVTILGLGGRDMDVMGGPTWLLWVERILHRTLVDGGCTTMRDVGGATHLVKRLVDDGLLIGPRLKVSICMLSTTGGHADFRGPDRCHGELSRLWPPGPGRPGSIVDGPWACRQRVREVAACGADLIKVCASPGVASPGDALEHREFTPEELAAITDEAAARGLPVAAHAHSRSGIALAVEHGVQDIQHISFLDEPLAERARERGCTVTPTSWIMRELLSAEGLPDAVMAKVRQVSEVHGEAVRLARAGGLPILAGTDPVLPGMHGRNHMEITALVEDGLLPLEAWFAATGRAAASIGQPDAGSLRPGQRADLLVCTEDVVDDPSALDRGALLEVLKDGVGHRQGVAGVPQRRFETGLAERLATPHAS